MIELDVNGERRSIDADPDMPLLWALREELGLRGTKFGCGVGACGACMVHIDGEATFSCLVAIGDLGEDARIRTIEGPATAESAAVIEVWTELQVAQCGFCQPGQIMRATALLAETPGPTDEEITTAMEGNLCRCATYPRIKAAILRASELLAEEKVSP